MFTRQNARDRGARGGRATRDRYGVDHLREIGRNGYLTTLARHWQGDRRGFARWLHGRAAWALADARADVALRQQRAAGRAVACVELPGVEEDEEPPW